MPSLELMRDGGLDAISLAVQFPETNITETSILHQMHLLPLSDEVIDHVNRKLGTYRSVIPAGPAGMLLLVPGFRTDIAGLLIASLVVISQWRQRKRALRPDPVQVG